MIQQSRIHIKWYILADAIASIISWVIFYSLRKTILNEQFLIGKNFYIGLIAMPIAWVSLFTLAGSYRSLYLKSRLFEFFHTAIVCVIGALFVLFFFVLYDSVGDNSIYYKEFLSLFTVQFFITYFIRLLILNKTKKQINIESVFFNTLIVGNTKMANDLFKAITENAEKTGYRICGFVNINDTINETSPLPNLGSMDNLESIIKLQKIEEIIIAINKNERDILEKILQRLSATNINIKITPDRVDILSGAVHDSNVMGVPLIDLHSGLLPSWQQNIKRVIDAAIASIALIVLIPLLIYTAIRVWISNGGKSIFYTQERIGYKGKAFSMYKFRSMMENAEKTGPQLSNDFDTRITKWGKIMRKWRLDELPQLVNIIKGEMSLVGPRPERKYYIDLIVQQKPEYKYLFKVKPGLSSWGMVKFGYASSVDEMIERMKYDLIYIENASLLLDFKIMFHTVKIIWSGKGK